MNEPFYEFTILNEAHRFDFVSIGRETFQKSIIYYKTANPIVVTLTLGNVMPDGSLDVFSVSNNGDRDKILATVARSIQTFLKIYPHLTIAFTGSTPSRTRLYKMGIGKELDSLKGRYFIRGISESGIEAFDVRNQYDAFLISLK